VPPITSCIAFIVSIGLERVPHRASDRAMPSQLNNIKYYLRLTEYYGGSTSKTQL